MHKPDSFGRSVFKSLARGVFNRGLFNCVALGIALVAGGSAALAADDPQGLPRSVGSVASDDPRFDKLIAPGAKITLLAEGFKWAEGPVWSREGGYLLFSDIPNNRIEKWSEKDGLSDFMKPAGYTGVAQYSKEPGTNGLTFDREGRLVACEHGDRRISRLEKNGGKRTLADNYQGKRFNSPNDLVYKSNGDLYFTDPFYGLPLGAKDPSRELDYCGVFRLGTDGRVTLLTRDMVAPNGIAFSPDEKTLYVAQSDGPKPYIMAFEVTSDGTLGPGKVLFDYTPITAKTGKPGAADGLKVDSAGNLFATGPGGVHVISADGVHLGAIYTGDLTANCAWGGDGSTLYMTVNKQLMKIETKTKGDRIP